MRMRAGQVIAVSLICALAVASAWLWDELRDERARNAELLARLEEGPRPLPAVANEPPVQPSLAAPSTPSPAAASPVAAPVAKQPALMREGRGDYERRMMQDPRYREARREQERLKLALRRDNLVRLLGLSPEQADAVIDLQIEHEWQQADVWRSPDAGESRQQRQQRADAQEEAYQAKLQQLLGWQKNEQLKHYMESRQSRMQVLDFGSQLSGVDMLRDDQIEPLIDVLHVERTRMRTELREFRDTLNWDDRTSGAWLQYGERQTQLTKKMNTAMHASAAAILSPSQLEQLDAMLENELRRHETRMRMSRLGTKIERAATATD